MVSGNLPVTLLLAPGPRTGVGELRGGWIIPEWIMYHMKAKDTMAGIFWKEMKQTMPA